MPRLLIDKRNTSTKESILFVMLCLFAFLMTIVILGRILFDQGAPYSADPGAFFRITSHLADSFLGKRPLTDTLRSTGERTVTMMFPAAVVATLTGMRSPEFYMSIAWFLYVLRLPFIYLLLIKSIRDFESTDFAIATLFLATSPILNLGVLYFTDVPSLTLAMAGLVLVSTGANKQSVWRIALGLFLLAMAVSVRLPNAVPFLMALLLLACLKWNTVIKSWKPLLKGVLFAIAAAILVGTFLRFDIPIIYAFKLNASWDQTIWKYGNANLEYGVSNIFLFRFWNFIRSTFWMLLPLITLLLLSLLFGLIAPSGHKNKDLPWYGLATLLCIVLYCAYAAKTMFYNARYVIPVVTVFLPILAATKFPRMASKVIIVTCILFSLDNMIYHSDIAGKKTPISGNLLVVHPGWMAPIKDTSGRTLHSPVPTFVDTLLSSGALDRQISVEFLTLQSPLLHENHLRFYLQYMETTSELSRRAANNIRINGVHNGELRIPEIYERYAARNAIAYSNADFIVAPIDTDTLPDYVKFWVESSLQDDIYGLTLKNMEETVGLKYAATLLGAFKEEPSRKPSRYVLYEVVNRDAFAALVKKHFCQLQNVKNVLYGYWCGDLSNANPLKELSVAKETMAISAAIIGSSEEPLLKILLKWPPTSGFSRIFVHFVPETDFSKDCRFFTVDHDVLNKNTNEDLAPFPKSKIDALCSCSYDVKVGVHVNEIGQNIFDANAFQLLTHKKSTQ